MLIFWWKCFKNNEKTYRNLGQYIMMSKWMDMSKPLPLIQSLEEKELWLADWLNGVSCMFSSVTKYYTLRTKNACSDWFLCRKLKLKKGFWVNHLQGKSEQIWPDMTIKKCQLKFEFFQFASFHFKPFYSMIN
jgi:hypothetical protein